MKSIIRAKIAETFLLNSNTERREAAIALFRISAQYICYSLAEWCVWALRKDTDTLLKKGTLGRSALPELDALLEPSDGTLITIAESLMILASNLGWAEPASSYFKKVSQRDAVKLAGPNKREASVTEIMSSVVEFRNDSPQGHGLPDSNPEAAYWLIDAVSLLIERTESALPTYDESTGRLHSGPSDKTVEIKTLRVIDGNLTLIRKIKRLPNGQCRVDAQRQISISRKEDVRWECNNAIRWHGYRPPAYDIAETWRDDWAPLALIPERIVEHFSGRDAQLQQLAGWADDEDSRMCLVYGDGGIGKTTLVVEFIHRILEGKIKLQWRPEAITFLTAKQTRWGIQGLEIISSQKVGLTSFVADIVRALEETPFVERRWIEGDPMTLIQRLGGYLADNKVPRKSHLLILDNTETLAVNGGEVERLAKEVTEMSRRVGRTIITSRRRERLEAYPLEIPPFSSEESILFLRKRADALNKAQMQMAGDPTLRKFADKLGRKPLVLEVFVQSLGADGRMSLQSAFDRVLRMQRQDLGEFLYEDAWKRLSSSLQHLLLLMTRVSDLHDTALLKLCCLETSVTVLEAEEALGESHGIAERATVSGIDQYSISPGFMQFAAQRVVRIDGLDRPTDNSVKKVKKRYEDFMTSLSAKISDRIVGAYRTPFARAAWLAYQEERWDDCEIYYESAVAEDPSNGLLFDRYAYVLFRRKRLLDALEKANEAVRLAPTEREPWFTKGLIEARLGQVTNSLQSLDRSRSLGKEEHLVYVQQAHAYLQSNPANPKKALRLLQEAKEASPADMADFRVRNHMNEVERLINRVTSMLR